MKDSFSGSTAFSKARTNVKSTISTAAIGTPSKETEAQQENQGWMKPIQRQDKQNLAEIGFIDWDAERYPYSED